MNSRKRSLPGIAAFFGEHTILVALLLMWLLLTVTTSRFRSWDNFISILQEASFIGISGLGMTFCIITGGLDLSSGSLIALLAVINMMMLNAVNTFLLLPVTLLLGILLRLILFFLVKQLCRFFKILLRADGASELHG